MTIITVMVATGWVSQIIIRKSGKRKMNSFFQESLFAGLALSLVAYVIGMALKKN